MTLQFEPNGTEFHSLNMVHYRTSTEAAATPQRLLSASIPRTQDTLASLYKRQSTLNQQLASNRLLLEQQQTENERAMILATARDRANSKLQRKLERLRAASPPDSSLATLLPNSPSTIKAQKLQKQRYLSLLEQYRQWQYKVDQQQVELEKAKERTRQAQQQLVCLCQINQSINNNNDRRHQNMAMHHALLKTLDLVRGRYVDWTEDMLAQWHWLLDGDNSLNALDIKLPSSIVADRMGTLKEEMGNHLEQDGALRSELEMYLGHLATLYGDT